MSPVTHARLSASGSATWMNCAAAPRLQDGIEEPTSIYAQDGTDKHAQAEHMLKSAAGTGPFPEHTEFVSFYVDYVKGMVATGDQLLIEQQVSFDEWVPEGFGTCDALILHHDGTLTVADLKGGSGVKVYAAGNSQLRLYALGALQAHQFDHGTQQVCMMICQPALDHIDIETISVDELLQWGELVKERAKATTDPQAKATPGPKQCRWCKARFTCRARAIDALSASESDYLTPADVAALLPLVPKVSAWISDLETHATKLATDGTEVPGYKLVESNTKRKFKDDAADALREAGLSDEQIFTRTFKTLTEVEKALGGKRKAAPIMDEVCVKPEGKPALVPISDPRPPLQAATVTHFPEGN